MHKQMIEQSLKAVEKSQLVFFVLDAQDGVTLEDDYFASVLKKRVSDISKIRETEIKIEINNYYKNVRDGCERRACEIKRSFINQPSKLLIEKEIKKAKKCEIKKYECQNKSLTENNEIMMSDVFNFYKIYIK